MKLHIAGFTIIEVLISLTIFIILALTLFQVYPFQSRVIKESKDTTVATNLAQGVIEEELQRGYENLTVQDGTKERFTTDVSSPYYNFWKEVDVSFVDSNLQPTGLDRGYKKIETTIYYMENGREKSTTMASLSTNAGTTAEE